MIIVRWIEIKKKRELFLLNVLKSR